MFQGFFYLAYLDCVTKVADKQGIWQDPLMPMTEEQKERARQYRRQVYREQKDALDKLKRDQKNARRAEKEKLLWSLIKTADSLEAGRDENANGPR